MKYMTGKAATVVTSIFVGIAVGSAAVQGLHAQTKPPVYFIAENQLTNPDGYKNEYLPLAQASIKAHGGRYLAAGDATSFAGDPPKGRVVVLVWDSMEQLKGWFESPEYQKARAVGEKYAHYRNYAIPGR